MAPAYSDVTVDYMFVDNAAMQIIPYPKQFDVILTENMFGDIISDEASVFCGSPGLHHPLLLEQARRCSSPFMAPIRRLREKILPTRFGSILSAANDARNILACRKKVASKKSG